MTVSSSITTHSYIPAGAMLAYSLSGLVFINTSDLVVTDPDGAVQLLGTDYEITGDGRTGAASIRTLRVYDADIFLTVTRVTDSVQEAVIAPNQPLPAEAVEKELDRRALVEQETRRDLVMLDDRAVKAVKGETGGTLPVVAVRAGKYFAFDAAGNPAAATAPVTGDDGFRLDAAQPGGSALVGYQNSGAGAVPTSIQKKQREEASLWDIIPDNLRAAIEAGTSTTDVVSFINQALQNYKRLIVRNGIYRISTPVLFASSGQRLEFEDNAWFHPLNATTNGIAVPHNLLDCELINPGLIGETAASNGATGIFWNTNAAGTAAFGSPISDDMGGLIQDSRFKQASGAKGWNNFIHMNMAGSVEVIRSKGRGLIGTASGQGYGLLFSGSDVTVRDVDYDSVIAGQGRHGIYFGDRCINSDVSGFTLRNFRKSSVSANAGETFINAYIRLSNGYIQNGAADADSSATNAAIEMSYQGAATAGGSVINISDVQVNGAGASGAYIRGYANLTMQNVTFRDWGAAPGGSYSGVKLEQCDNATLNNVVSRSSAENNGSSLLIHVSIKESSNVRVQGGGAYNTGTGAQRGALALDSTGFGTPNTLIDRFVVSKGSGSWSADPFSNPNQNGSTIIYAKQGAVVVDTQTGADITLDAADGQSVFVLDAGATSVLQIASAGPGQIVTLRMTGNTQIKQSNIYSPSVFNATTFDTCQLVCITGVGTAATWAEVSRSVN